MVVVVLAALTAIRRNGPSTATPAIAVDDQAAVDGEPPSDPPTPTGMTRPTSEDVSQRETNVGDDEKAMADESDGDGADNADTTSTASTALPAVPEEVPSTTASTQTTSETTAPVTTTTAPPITVASPDLCETQTQGDETRGVEVKYLDSDAFASTFRFYGSAQQLLYDTTTLDDNPTNRVLREGYYEREWDIAANPSGFEPRDVYYVSAVEPEGESALIRCARSEVTDGG